MRIVTESDGLTLEGAWYRLRTRGGERTAWLDDLDSGARWAELRPLASIDTETGTDETLAVAGPDVDADGDAVRLTWRLASSRWPAKRVVFAASDETLIVHAEVEGAGRPTNVRLLGGSAVLPRTTGPLMSGAWFETVLCPSPTDPARLVKPASESAVIGVVSGSDPGRGNWFFTPGPFCYAMTRSRATDPAVVPAGPWLTVGLAARPGEAGFAGFGYQAIDRGFAFELDYEGKAPVDGTWRTPRLVIARADDPYRGIAGHRAWLEAAGLAAPRGPRHGPDWWREPIFCGWGEQCRAARHDGGGWAAAPAYSTADRYDAMLGHLEARGVVPGTITIDDKWQSAYGTNEPDRQKWPDLRGWIAGRHDRGQRVLLWWKAWDPEGLPAELCVRTELGEPLGIDPTNPAGTEAIRTSIRRMLAADQLDADGLKIDFTARTPSGRATVHHGPEWGVDLLRRLLTTVHEEAKRVKPQALLVGHVPNPLVAPAVDMIRLNDTLRLDDPEARVDVVPQMRHRAAIVRAACPDHLVDTDDWCAPDLASWRSYLAAKPDLGVPALYYATGLDLSGEAFEDDDYAAIRRTWSGYRASAGLPG